ncbi:MAG TPA: serine hydrolase domain-containing protein [Candidatus Sulfopaludibacter sp.]|jgi:CubicO group peptidase (beta-lactamase class C family)|nr:serine hydrolase domain-containing protein [Candidatus Sulfopaludibacter sp.]
MAFGGARCRAIGLAAFLLTGVLADDRSDAVDSLLAPFRGNGGPGCAIAVVQKGKLLYSAAFGFSDVEARTAITAATPFNVASLSKQFTAAALYFLVQDGRVHVTDSVRLFVPELPAYTDAVTVADLLHHTSGLRDVHPLREVAGRLGETLDGPANLRLLAAQSGLNFPPGTDYEYSNSDYFLLALIVERVAATPFAEFADSHLFRPLGMTHSAFRAGHPGYVLNGERFRQAPPPPLTDGDGGLYTTLDDLRLWDDNLYTGRVGGPDFVRFLEASGRLRSGQRVGYAAGLSVGRYRGARVVSHDGLLPGYRADFTQFPDHRLSSILLCNRGDVDAPSVNRRIASIYLTGRLKGRKQAEDLDYPTSEFPELDGVWESKQGWILRAWSSVDGMTIDTGGEQHKLLPLDRRRLFADEGGFRLILTKLSGQTFTLQWDGALPVTYDRLQPVPQRAEQLKSLTGVYRSADAGAVWTLRFEQGVLYITTSAGWKIPLEPVGSDRFTVGPWSLHVARDSEGRPRGLSLHRARLWDLWFEWEGAN